MADLPTGWDEVPFEEAIDFQEGPGIMARDFRPEGVPLIRLAGLSDNGSLLDGCNYLDPEMVAKKWSHFRIEEGDTLLSASASLGRVARVDKGAAGSVVYTGIIRMRPRNSRVISEYIRFLLESQHFQEQAEAVGAGSVLRHFGPSHLRAMTVLLPPVPIQRSIASIGDAIDQRVWSGRRLRSGIETLAASVLMSELGSDHGTWEWTWPETTLGEVLDVLETGGRPKGGVAGIASGVPSIGAESIVGAGIFDFGKVKYVPRDFYESMNRGHLIDADVLLYKDGGRPGQFEPHVSLVGEGFPFETASINEHVYRLRISEPYTQEFLYLWLRSERVSEEMRRRGTGVAIPGLNSTNVRALPMIVPDPAKLKHVQEQIGPMMRTVLRRAREERKLRNLRGTLLPSLMTGRITVQGRDLVEVA